MKLHEIKAAYQAGRLVCCHSTFYQVIQDSRGVYFICPMDQRSPIRLTHLDGETLNADEEEFFIAD